jgi:Flp pilus assembly protein TadD
LPSPFAVNPLIAAVVITAFAIALPASAQKPPLPPSPASEIGALMKAGQNDEALRRAEARLKENPRDAQVRFMRGVILTDLGRQVEAATAFEALIAEFPELPEPYNNLAVIRAAQGSYDSAWRLLQQALAAQPNYITALENLGDLHLSMAEAAYGKALGFDKNSSRVQSKLEATRDLIKRVRETR